MSGDAIALCVIVWVVLAFIMLFGLTDDEAEGQTYTMMFFWPITLAVFLIIGPLVAIYATVRRTLGLFKAK